MRNLVQFVASNIFDLFVLAECQHPVLDFMYMYIMSWQVENRLEQGTSILGVTSWPFKFCFFPQSLCSKTTKTTRHRCEFDPLGIGRWVRSGFFWRKGDFLCLLYVDLKILRFFPFKMGNPPEPTQEFSWRCFVVTWNSIAFINRLSRLLQVWPTWWDMWLDSAVKQ